jgi:hypothetical protein
MTDHMTDLFGDGGGVETEYALPILLAQDGRYDDRGAVGGTSGRGNQGTRKNLHRCFFVHNEPHMI